MSTKHTPGPWGFNVGKNGAIAGLPVIRVYSYSAEDKVCDFAHANGEQDLANARLIAAAPEMLEALKAIWEMRNCPIVDDDFPRLRDIADTLLVNALKKAEGEK